MCGIFGVRNTPDAVALTKLGLYSLQHRGQESAGVVAVEHNGIARGVRSMGLVSDMAHTQLDALHGTMAIGHTRYSTTGSLSKVRPSGFTETSLLQAATYQAL